MSTSFKNELVSSLGKIVNLEDNKSSLRKDDSKSRIVRDSLAVLAVILAVGVCGFFFSSTGYWQNRNKPMTVEKSMEGKRWMPLPWQLFE